MNINDYKEVLHKVYDLSVVEASKEKSRKPVIQKLGDINHADYLKQRPESELLKYLESLDSETIKVVLAVMYLGRDFVMTSDEYKSIHDNPDDYDMEYLMTNQKREYPKTPVSDPSGEVERYMKDICNESMRGHESNQIYGKRLLLDKYFLRAFNILGI